MADHATGRSLVGQRSRGSNEIGASDVVGLFSDSCDECLDLEVVAVLVEVGSIDRATVEVCGGPCQEIGEPARQRRCSPERAECLQPAQQWLPGFVVHEHPGPVEFVGRAARCADGRDGEPAAVDVALDGGLECGRVGVGHHVEPSTDARFYVQFFREPDAAMVPGVAALPAVDRSGPWASRGSDLDDEDEIVEMVTRQYVDVGQDDLLQPFFAFGPGFIDWQAHIGAVADYWCHVLLYAPGYEIDVTEHHRNLHDAAPFTPEVFDRWLQIFHDTVNGGWAGPNATAANKRATGMAWAMAQRFLGHGVWRPAGRG